MSQSSDDIDMGQALDDKYMGQSWDDIEGTSFCRQWASSIRHGFRMIKTSLSLLTSFTSEEAAGYAWHKYILTLQNILYEPLSLEMWNKIAALTGMQVRGANAAQHHDVAAVVLTSNPQTNKQTNKQANKQTNTPYTHPHTYTNKHAHTTPTTRTHTHTNITNS